MAGSAQAPALKISTKNIGTSASIHVASHLGNPSLISVETTRLTAAEKEALATLLDDPSPTVHQALLAQLTGLGTEGRDFLVALAHGTNRVTALTAGEFLRELKYADPVADFRKFIRSLNYELETGMLLLNRTVNPALDVAGICSQLDALAARCRKLTPASRSLREQCRGINRVLFAELGLRGNAENYTDPNNCLLEQVLARHLGIPLSLSVVYLLVAQRLGLELEPVAAPGHFLVGGYEPGGPFFLDAFNQGQFLTPDDVFERLRSQQRLPELADLAPTPVREVLSRCCRDLRNHYKATGDEHHARLFASFVAEFDLAYERHAQP